MKILIILLLSTSLAQAANMERCSYKTEHDGKISETVKPATLADGSNAKRFAEIAKWEEDGKEGWKGYRTFDVRCLPLDIEKPIWHMFVQTHNGQVSLAHGLTEDACYFTLNRLKEVSWGCNNCTRMVQPSDFEHGECFK